MTEKDIHSEIDDADKIKPIKHPLFEDPPVEAKKQKGKRLNIVWYANNNHSFR